MKNGSYAGRIKNKGSQEVKAPFQQQGTKKGIVKKGGDLRTKAGNKQCRLNEALFSVKQVPFMNRRATA